MKNNEIASIRVVNIQKTDTRGEVPPPGLDSCLFSMCSHSLPLVHFHGFGENSGASFFPHKSVNPMMKAPSSWPHLKEITFQGHSSKYHYIVGNGFDM